MDFKFALPHPFLIINKIEKTEVACLNLRPELQKVKRKRTKAWNLGHMYWQGRGEPSLKRHGPNKCAVDFLYMIHILIRESTFEVRDRDFWITRRRAALIEKWVAILVRGLQYDMRCALVPVGITKFTKLIERATEFKEVVKERSTPSTSRNAWFPTA